MLLRIHWFQALSVLGTFPTPLVPDQSATSLAMLGPSEIPTEYVALPLLFCDQ
uniref:Uncharacterized protein n=1 Tax=Arundo donax TaxID=35708 RepID=A0A0A8XRQ7_ARUDO